MKLHLGCGKRDFGTEWISIDGGDFPHLHSHDITKLDFKDNTVDLIYSSHVLEYFDRVEVIDVLNEWKRVLKPNGILRIAVPDFESMVKLYLSGKYNLENFLGPIFGKMEMSDEVIYHRTTYDYNSLKKILEKVGFLDIKLYNWKETEHSHIDDHSQAYLPHMDKQNGTLISLNIECKK
jgi:predicted SAM-dependent methyltransferase